MNDLEIKYPKQFDILPITTTVSINIGDTMNSFRDAILNLEEVLGLDVNIGLFTPDPSSATVADRLNRIERGIAERNLVFREINVSDALQVMLDQNNQPFVRIGLGSPTQVAPVTIVGPLTILSPNVANPLTLIQTPVRIDLSTLNPEASTHSFIKGKSNSTQPLLTIQDTRSNPAPSEVALKVTGNMVVTGKLTADFAIDHSRLLNIDTVPTDATRGIVKHVTQGNFHSHRKGKYNIQQQLWEVDSSIDTSDHGIIRHSNLVGVGTLPTHGDDYQPQNDIAYHVTGGDLHSHKTGDGSQIDHNDLKNISPKLSNHVTGGDSHAHTSAQDGGTVSHKDLSDIETTGTEAIHVTGGDSHAHTLDSDGNPVGDGTQIDHKHLKNITTVGADSVHVTGGDSHKHSSDGDGGQVDHTTLSNVGTLTHDEIEARLVSFRATKTGTATFTASNYNEVQVQHGLGTDSFNVAWSLSGVNYVPPSDPADVGVIYVSDKTNSTFKFKRLGGSIPGPATKASLTTSITGTNNDLTFYAKTAGIVGNSISIKYEVNSSITSNPFIVSSLTSVLVMIKTPYPTSSAVRLAILSDAIAKTIVDVVDATGNTGVGLVDAYSTTNLSGGLDASGFSGMELEYIAVAKT